MRSTRQCLVLAKEDTMNHNDNPPDLSTLIDPELEARVVAWVSGEASPFEAAELARLTGEKPELAIFKRRIEAVRGLVAEAIRPDPERLLLSPDRRAKLLQALGAPESKATPAVVTSTVVLPKAASRKAYRKTHWWTLGIAACLTLGLFTMMAIPSFQKVRRPKFTDSMSEGADSEPREPADYKERDRVISLNMPPAPASAPVAVNGAVQMMETRALDDHEYRDMAMKSQMTDAAKRKLEKTDMERLASVRGAVEQQNINLAIRQKREREAQYGSESRGQPTAHPTAQAKTEETSPYPKQTVASWAGGGKKIAPTSTSAEPIVLSPFVVESSKDAGYAAVSTLAGTRVRTDLKDVASAISVVTSQFLKDTGAHNDQDLLLNSPNTEVGGARGNFGTPHTNSPLITGIGLEKGEADQFRDGSINPNSIIEEDKAIKELSVYELSSKGDVGDKNGQSLDGPKITVEENAEAPPARKPAQQPETTLAEINAAKEPVSTFSLHVSDVSFRLAQAALAKGAELDRASIRPEEFYNAFSYGDPTPALAEKVSCRIEQAAHPFLQQRNLVRIAVKVAAAGRDAAQPLHLTVLLDTSGSMEREDRAATVHSAMQALVSLLGPNDRLTLIGFARQPRLLAESLPGDQAAQVLDIIKKTPAEGGTNLEEALKLGSELAHRQFDAAAQNRIVILTDGAANLGNANPAQLAAAIETLRQQGIAFDACGVGLEGLDDAMLENLTRKGDGRYYVLNSPEAADAEFAHQLAGAFRPAAENVKLQVRFNPARVGNYRLIGFEQHRLREEDFRNDRVDAAELAAEEAAVAVYQVEALPQGEGELGEVYVRFRDASSGNMVERSWTLNYDAQAPVFDRATPTIQLAGTAALLAEKLHGGQTGDAIKLGDLAPVVNQLRSHYANEPRVQELVTMFEQARKLAGE
jgi:secreted protein with Ig-like and vWFA domain